MEVIDGVGVMMLLDGFLYLDKQVFLFIVTSIFLAVSFLRTRLMSIMVCTIILLLQFFFLACTRLLF